MDIAKSIIKLIDREGIVLADKSFTHRLIDEAICEGRFEFIVKDGQNIGFFTHSFDKVARIIKWENMLIFKAFRGKFNVLTLRNLMYAKYGDDVKFAWRNRKKQQDREFKQRGLLCHS